MRGTRTGGLSASCERVLEYGVRAPVFYRSLREKMVFHESIQEACFILTEISGNLRQSSGECNLGILYCSSLLPCAEVDQSCGICPAQGWRTKCKGRKTTLEGVPTLKGVPVLAQRLAEYGWDPHRDFGTKGFLAGPGLHAEIRVCAFVEFEISNGLASTAFQQSLSTLNPRSKKRENRGFDPSGVFLQTGDFPPG